MTPEEQKDYEEHYSPDGERIQYLMEHPEELLSEADSHEAGAEDTLQSRDDR